MEINLYLYNDKLEQLKLYISYLLEDDDATLEYVARTTGGYTKLLNMHHSIGLEALYCILDVMYYDLDYDKLANEFIKGTVDFNNLEILN